MVILHFYFQRLQAVEVRHTFAPGYSWVVHRDRPMGLASPAFLGLHRQVGDSWQTPPQENLHTFFKSEETTSEQNKLMSTITKSCP